MLKVRWKDNKTQIKNGKSVWKIVVRERKC